MNMINVTLIQGKFRASFLEFIGTFLKLEAGVKLGFNKHVHSLHMWVHRAFFLLNCQNFESLQYF